MRTFFETTSGLKGLVLRIAEDELQRVRTGREVDARLGLPGAEMQVVPVGRDRLGRVQGLVDVDQKVMVADIGACHRPA